MDDSGVESKLVENGNEEKCVVNVVKVEEDEDEAKKLLLPKKGGLSKKKSGKKQRKVQWNDRNGHKLTEVLEYQPSFLEVAKELR
ncbi:actin-related protein 2/3 complex subunit 2 [Tanacetum coccineum]